MVVWLEDSKIGAYPVEIRQALHDTESDTWGDFFAEYVEKLGSQFPTSERTSVMAFLLQLAVAKDYDRDAATYNRAKANSKPAATADSHPYANVDVNSQDFKRGVASLAALLDIPAHPDDATITLKAIAALVQQRLIPEALKNLDRWNKHQAECTKFELSEIPLGFDLGSERLNEAAKCLRLLHIGSLRDLQTLVDESIVAAQQLTADPKTNQALGKVGRM